jgi:E1-E2 ATPase/Cation transporter/ATPase, N-terminus
MAITELNEGSATVTVNGGTKKTLTSSPLELTRFDYLPIQAALLLSEVQAQVEKNQSHKPNPNVCHQLAKKQAQSKKKKEAVDLSPLFPVECYPSFQVDKIQLGHLCEERNRTVLAEVLEQAVLGGAEAPPRDDLEAGSERAAFFADVKELCMTLKHYDHGCGHDDHGEKKAGGPVMSHGEMAVLDHYAEIAASLFALAVLRTLPEQGLPANDGTPTKNETNYGITDSNEVMYRRYVFGANGMEPKPIVPWIRLCFDAIQDFVLCMLIILGFIIIGVEAYHLEPGEKCTICWIDGTVVIVAVLIVVMVTASIDYMKQFTFIRLTKSLHESNTKMVLRGNGTQTVVIDDEIVVGDILLVNSHSLATVPADCMVLGPSDGDELKMDEAALTGESKLIGKKPGDIVLSGTNAAQGSAKLLVLAVGINSVAGKIKARVYETNGGDGDDDIGGDDEKSPLFNKIDALAQRVGVGGTIMATISFLGSLIIGLGIEGDPASDIVDYLITAITVLAVAVPEGLPLAVTLSLAFSSSKMMSEQNLVKHLDACETMGCATTICTDKTGKYKVFTRAQITITFTSPDPLTK